MSASFHTPHRGAQIVNLTDKAAPLHRIAEELQAYFALARQWESELAEKRAAVDSLQTKLSALTSRADQDAESVRTLRASESAAREQLARVEEAHRRLTADAEQMRQRLQQTTAERDQEQGLRAALQGEVTRLAQQLRSMGSVSQSLSEAIAREQRVSERATELQRQESALRAELRKREIESEVDRSRSEMLTRKSDAQATEIQTLQAQLHQARVETHQLQQSLSQYRGRWEQMRNAAERGARVAQEHATLSEKSQTTARRLEDLEATAKKDRRDKQIALNCLNEAERRIDRLTEQLNDLRARAFENSFSGAADQVNISPDSGEPPTF